MEPVYGNQKGMNHGKFISASLSECPLGKCGQRKGCLRSEQIGMILINVFNFPMTLHHSHWICMLSEHVTLRRFLNRFIYQISFHRWERREGKKNINTGMCLACRTQGDLVSRGLQRLKAHLYPGEGQVSTRHSAEK